jgi:hypothetical protein
MPVAATSAATVIAGGTPLGASPVDPEAPATRTGTSRHSMAP